MMLLHRWFMACKKAVQEAFERDGQRTVTWEEGGMYMQVLNMLACNHIWFYTEQFHCKQPLYPMFARTVHTEPGEVYRMEVEVLDAAEKAFMEILRVLPRELLARAVLLDKKTDVVYIPSTVFEKLFTAVMGDWFDLIIGLTREVAAGSRLPVDRASLRLLFYYPLVLWGNWNNGTYSFGPGVYSVYKEMVDAMLIVGKRAAKGEALPIVPVLHPSFIDYFSANGPDWRPYAKGLAQLARDLFLHFSADKAGRVLKRILLDEPRLGTLVVGSPEAAAVLLRPLLEMASIEALAMEGTSKTIYIDPVKDADGTVTEARIHGIAWWALIIKRGRLLLRHLYESSCPGSSHVNRAKREGDLLLLLCAPNGHLPGGWWRFLRAPGIAQLFTLMVEPFWNAFLPKGSEPYRTCKSRMDGSPLYSRTLVDDPEFMPRGMVTERPVGLDDAGEGIRVIDAGRNHAPGTDTDDEMHGLVSDDSDDDVEVPAEYMAGLEHSGAELDELDVQFLRGRRLRPGPLPLETVMEPPEDHFNFLNIREEELVPAVEGYIRQRQGSGSFGWSDWANWCAWVASKGLKYTEVKATGYDQGERAPAKWVLAEAERRGELDDDLVEFLTGDREKVKARRKAESARQTRDTAQKSRGSFWDPMFDDEEEEANGEGAEGGMFDDDAAEATRNVEVDDGDQIRGQVESSMQLVLQDPDADMMSELMSFFGRG
ncbi:hypothetical protein GPECTOR_368g149 [Gonium pectorale]|uniref:Uncharacterized protein n=1 Tax=Gonium pectorale TaxID=33097 RepID=A0A150FWL9_GONPE|nr:hypothetical protein GPECTOR_368g149 [Gonium pectorale]|eukprot:KXZ41605.1 hypothetical protein GPECTOR_368g149 [Gonium pectorale]